MEGNPLRPASTHTPGPTCTFITEDLEEAYCNVRYLTPIYLASQVEADTHQTVQKYLDKEDVVIEFGAR